MGQGESTSVYLASRTWPTATTTSDDEDRQGARSHPPHPPIHRDPRPLIENTPPRSSDTALSCILPSCEPNSSDCLSAGLTHKEATWLLLSQRSAATTSDQGSIKSPRRPDQSEQRRPRPFDHSIKRAYIHLIDLIMIADPPPAPYLPLLSSPYRRDRQRRPSSEWDNQTSLSAMMATESESQRGRRRSSLAPPLADLHVNSINLASQTKSTEPLVSEDSASERGLKRRRRSSAVDKCDEMRRMSLKRCNGSGGLVEQVDDIKHRQAEQPQRAHVDSSCQLMTTNGATDVSSSSTSVSYSSTSASASTSSLVKELDATSLSTPLAASDDSSTAGQGGPVKQIRQQPVFTCPFTPYAQDRREHSHSMRGYEDHSLDIDRGDRRNSSISSQHTRRDSGWSTTESGRGTTMTSGISSPAASTVQEWKPFPVDKLPRDIINLILDHVLGSPEFGQNGRWKDKRGQEEDKVQMVKALKVGSLDS